MCRKLLLLIAVLGLVGTAWAEDINPPPWRGELGSTMSHWTYDAPPPLGPGGDPYPSEDSFPRIDAPDAWSYVSHPEKQDPDNFVQRSIDEYWTVDYPLIPPEDYEAFGMQLWGDYEWQETYKDRSGVLTPFNGGSWDIFNFWSEPPQPEKLIWIQMTWAPYTITTGWYECEERTWNYTDWGEPEEVWDSMVGGTFDLGVTYYDADGTPVYLGEPYDTEVTGFNYELEAYPADGYDEQWEALGYPTWYDGELEAFEVVDHLDGWVTSKFLLVTEGNPYKEFFGLFPLGPPEGDPYLVYASEYEMPLSEWPENFPDPMETWMDGEVEWGWLWVEELPVDWDYEIFGDPMDEWMEQDRGPGMIALDQIVIDTICIPEPATIALLGLGGLFLIRRKKR